MAARLVAIAAATAVIGLVAGPLAAVVLRAGGWPTLGPGDLQAVRFTLWQALLSAGLSVLFAVPVARALARRRFRGRRLLITLMGAPFILPVIVAVLGLIAVFGQNGVLNALRALFGLPPLSVYGLHGVVLAHVFFNLPLATRMLLQAWLAVPSERLRLAASLGLGPRQMFRVIEWPLIMRVMPGAFAVIFVICLSSFAVALTLGGGPRATTVELAIYQAMRFDFDLARAAALSVIQLALALAAGLVAMRFANGQGFGIGRDRVLVLPTEGRLPRLLDTIWIATAALFLLLPLAMVVLRGLSGLGDMPVQVWQAAGHSLGVALVSTLLCLLWALALATRTGEWVGLAGIAVSPLVLGTGLFLILRPVVNPLDWALVVTTVVNALMGLPFALRILRPEAEAIRQDFGRLSAALGLSPMVWVTRVWLPRLRRPLGFAAGLTAALSMGDLGVIALFADPDRATLPLEVYRLMGAYRMDAAAGAALVLLAISLGLFWLFDRGGRVDVDA